MDKIENPDPGLVIQPGDEVLLYATSRDNLRKAVEIFAGKRPHR